MIEAIEGAWLTEIVKALGTFALTSGTLADI